MTPTLHTARLSLRPLARAEARVLAQIEAGTAMGWSVVPAGTDSIIGMVGLHHIDGTAAFAQIAYEIDGEYSGKGLATEAVERVIEHARTELGLLRLEAHIGPDNSRSIRLAERLGFVRETEVESTVVYTRTL
ncbi:MAG: GNAT family N-acetyltransferase [Deltaproteobacteria bacterium]|nr:MAG: GNAT family N-acetyltransferase [Deltaproteobacteria bacterium]